MRRPEGIDGMPRPVKPVKVKVLQKQQNDPGIPELGDLPRYEIVNPPVKLIDKKGDREPSLRRETEIAAG